MSLATISVLSLFERYGITIAKAQFALGDFSCSVALAMQSQWLWLSVCVATFSELWLFVRNDITRQKHSVCLAIIFVLLLSSLMGILS